MENCPKDSRSVRLPTLYNTLRILLRFLVVWLKKLAIYALGRLPEGSEVCVVDSIGKRAESSDYGFRDMVVDIGVELLAR